MSKTYEKQYAISEELRQECINNLKRVFSEFDIQDIVFVDDTVKYLPDDNFIAIMDWWMTIIAKGEEFYENPTEDNFERMLEDIIRREAWEEILAFDLKTGGWSLKAYQRVKKLMPADIIWELLLGIYIRSGFEFPVDEILEAKKYRMDDPCAKLPYEYNDVDELTVYRTSTTSYKFPQKVCAELSWTLSPSVAKEFYEMRLSRGEQPYAYKATLKKKDISDCPGFFWGFYDNTQKEILQYQGVFDLRYLSKSELDVACRIEELNARF